MFLLSTTTAASAHSTLCSSHQINPFPVTRMHGSPRSNSWMTLEVRKGTQPSVSLRSHRCFENSEVLWVLFKMQQTFLKGGGLVHCSSSCEEDLGKSTWIKASQCLTCHAQQSGQL